MSHPLLALPIFAPIALICLALGGMILRALGIKSGSLLEASVFGTAIGFGVLSYLVLGIGLAGMLTVPVLIGLLVVLAIVSFPGMRILIPALVRAVRERSGAKVRTTDALMLVGASILGSLALLGALSPPGPTDWDGLAYHLAVPKLYLAAHRIFYVPFTSHSNFPFLTEMLYTLGLALHGPALAKLFHYAMFIVTAAGICSLCRRHINPRAGAVGALLFMSVPLMVWEAGVAYADITTAMYLLLGVYAILNWEESADRGWLLAAGIVSGFALGTKMLALVPIGALLMWVLWIGNRRGDPSTVARWGTSIKWTALVGLLTALIGSLWYIKTYLYTGNPVYPFFYNIFGGRNWSQADADIYHAAQQAMGMGRSVLDFVMIPWNVTMNGGKFFDALLIYGLLGPAFLGLIAVTILIGRSEKAVGRLAFVCVVFIAAWFFLMQNARYIITILPLLSVIAGVGAARALRQWSVGRVIVSVFLVICVGLGIFTGYVLILGSARAALGIEPAESYLSRTLDCYDAESYVNDFTPKDARVLLFDEPRGFYLDRAYIWADPGHHELIPWGDFHSGDEMVRFFAAKDYTHAIINWNFMKGNDAYEQLIFQAIGMGRLLEVYGSKRVSVYEIRP